MHSHPALELLEQNSSRLSGKSIVVGVTGSIAAVESVKLIHELIRHGATVYPVMTPAACGIIDPEALKCASANKPITNLTGELEHVALCGKVKNKADLLLIAPATANTISKIANGIDDTTVTTFATTAIGSGIPIVIVPAMHNSMYEHPIVQENIQKLKDRKLNIQFIDPIRSENKYKIANVDTIVSRVIRTLWQPDLADKRVLIIAGATAENVDDMRVLSNRSTGVTGSSLAKMAFLRGAEVALWLGQAIVEPPEFIYCERFQTVEDLKRMVSKLNNKTKDNFDIIIVCAAISDYTLPDKIKGKIPSGKKRLSFELVPTTKILPMIRKKMPKSYIVGFKAESNISEKKLIDKALQRMTDWKLNLMVANDLTKVTKNANHIYIIHPKRKFEKVDGDKEILAERIFDNILK